MTVEQDAPADEAKGGKTSRGTPLETRDSTRFPTDKLNLFAELDLLRRAPDRKPHSLFEGESGTEEARRAIRGQNTWMLWTEGNEAFWGWLLQDRNYGITDFLILVDSRKRDTRFDVAGLVNQPGMKAQTDPRKKVLGLYLDQADDRKILLRPPEKDPGATSLFTPHDPKAYRETMRQLATDGVDHEIYGYPSGVVGLRLFPNPDFFAATPAAQRARERWKTRVEDRGDDYYTNFAIAADPELVRPFRIGMTCAFCHIGPHPLNPPADPNKPEWNNLSSLIGAQYWNGSKAFSNLKNEESFFFQLVASWQPGTLDTSLISSDHINNPNTMNALFAVPARLDRARRNPPEDQSAANLLVPGLLDPRPLANPRHTPRALIDGADSIDFPASLARVYLNIGAYSEQWRRLHNPIVGVRKQRPFELETINEKSAYWRASQETRIPELLAFFTYSNTANETLTAPMKLASAPEGSVPEARRIDAGKAGRGRAVFIENCAICHSSKQPEGFALTFSRDWAIHRVPGTGESARFVLPMDFAEWAAFKLSGAYREYLNRIKPLAGAATATPDPFLEDNYLSTDIRIPVTLVGTNSARAVATNAMKGQVWDNFSSDTYKNLPAVGAVRFYNPYSGRPTDEWGNNDVYYPPAGGPGYYRPASLVSLWATAPFLHNNALGRYTGKPSVPGRLDAFDDAVEKLLWKEKRPGSHPRPGDLRADKQLAGHDPGFIYRTTERSWIDIPGKFIRVLLVGVVGERWTSFLTRDLWWGLAAVAFLLAFFGRQQHAGLVLALCAVLLGACLRVTRIDTIYPSLWWIVAGALAGALLLWLGPRVRIVTPVFFTLLGAALLAVYSHLGAWLAGERGVLWIGPFPKGTPVNLVINVNPQAPLGDLVDAVSGLTRGLLKIDKDKLPDEGGPALRAFEAEAGLALLKASKCPDLVLDRGHWFAEGLSDSQKRELAEFLKTL
jgi:hypothetical protein